MELQQSTAEFEKLGLKVAGLSYDSVAILHNFAQRKGIRFPLLSDPSSSIIRELGILNGEVPKDSPVYGIPYPGVYILDEKGVVAAKYFEDDFRERTTAADILVRRFGLTPESRKSEVKGRQLTATVSQSASRVYAGQRVALIIDLELKPGMHVYAPGIEGYIPIDWELNASGAFAPHDAVYPKPETLRLEAIGETVPAYKGSIRLVRDITVSADAQLKPALDAQGQFVVEGLLRYQACDDRVCYIPQQLPLRWTFDYEAFDRERVPVELRRKAPGAQ